MLQYYTRDVLDRLVELDDSTTHFLESMRGDSLKVEIESQTEIIHSGLNVIRRVVRLYFDSPETPLLYCISFLKVSVLNIEEYKLLMDGRKPIGSVFSSGEKVRKKDISITLEIDEAIAASLNVKSSAVIRKKYDFWDADRKIGRIHEFFNEESLKRI